MMLIDELKKANIEAMKNKDKDARTIISVVLSKAKLLEVENKANNKEFNDNDVLQIIQKSLKELADEKQGYIKVNNQERVESIARQEAVIKKYLPAQLSEDEIRKEIETLEDKSIPNIMKHFKTNYTGRVDMSLVNKIAREN